MEPYQKLTSRGVQVALFPLPVLHVTQGIDGSYSHQGSYAMDFVGSSARAQLYAPCDLSLVNVDGHRVIYTSLSPVMFADGNVGYLTIRLLHDNDSYSIPRTVYQGDPIAKSGTAGEVTGDHIHIETKRGYYTGMHTNDEGTWMMNGSEPPFNLLAINNTAIINDGGYSWKTVQTGLPIWLMI